MWTLSIVRSCIYNLIRDICHWQFNRQNSQEKKSIIITENNSSPNVAAEETAREEKAELAKELSSFWKDLPHVLLRQPRLHDIARKDYEVKSLLVPQTLEDAEQKVSFDAVTVLLPTWS